MPPSHTWRAVGRLARWRSGLWWAVPIVLVTAALTFAFSVLTQMELSDDDFRVSQFGGADVAVSFNEAVPTTEAEFEAGEALAKLAPLATAPPCGTLTAFLHASAHSHRYYVYLEYVGDCDVRSWGHRLVVGRWPQNPGEVVASEGTGLAPGDVLKGIAPDDLTVTGLIVNDHSTRAEQLIAAPGTWRSWDWPTAKAAFPQVSAIFSAYLAGADAGEVRELFSEQQNNVLVTSATERAKPQLEKTPFLYLWVATPLALLATSLALGLRARFTSSRQALLVQQGIGPRGAARIVHLSNLVIVVLAGLLGVVLGWASGLASGALITWFVGHKPSSAPPPWDPMMRVVLVEALLVGAVLIGAQHRAPRADRARERGALRSRHPFARRLCALACTAIAISLVATIDAIESFFAVVFLLVLALGLMMPDAVGALLGRARPRGPVARLARARLRERIGTASLVGAAAAFTVGPVIAMMALLGSTVANENANARMPPRQGQALYNPIDEVDATGQLVREVMDEVVGTDLVVVPVYHAQDEAGWFLTATGRGLGLINLVDSVEDLETLLGSSVGVQARAALEGGGVLWNTKYAGRELWIADPSSPRRIELAEGVTEDYEERWARAGAGFILTATARALGLEVAVRTQVFDRVTAADAVKVSDALIARGVDGSLVRTYRAGDPHSVSPYQLGLVSLLGIVGVVVIVAATRGNVASLVRQSRELIAIGLPRGWLGRVFLVECALPMGWGIVAGIAVSLAATAVGIVRVRVPVDVPIVPILVYLAGLLAILVLVSAMALRRIRS